MNAGLKGLLESLAGLVEKNASQGDLEKDLAEIAYHSVVLIMKLKGEEARLKAARQLAQGLRYKNETGDTSLLEKYILEHPPAVS